MKTSDERWRSSRADQVMDAPLTPVCFGPSRGPRCSLETSSIFFALLLIAERLFCASLRCSHSRQPAASLCSEFSSVSEDEDLRNCIQVLEALVKN